jgi:hypothetical protein
MKKALQPYRDDDVVVSFDIAAFVKAVTDVAADVASGRKTPAEGRAFVRKTNAVLRNFELAIKLGRGAA